MIQPCGKQHGIHQFHAVDPFGTVHKQRFDAEDGIGKVIQNPDMLRVLAVGFDLDDLVFRLAEAAPIRGVEFAFGRFEFGKSQIAGNRQWGFMKKAAIAYAVTNSLR